MGVHSVRSKGKVYVYAWRGGPRIHATPGTDAFLQELALARAGRVAGDRSKVSGLCTAYRASTAYTGLSEKTRKEWELYI